MTLAVNDATAAAILALEADLETAMALGITGSGLDSSFVHHPTTNPFPYAGVTDSGLKDKIKRGWKLSFAAFMKHWPSVTAWAAPSLLNSWANHGGYEVAGYRTEGSRVFLKGTVSGGTSGTTAFVLPTGSRPPAKVRSPGGEVEVDSSGVVTLLVAGPIGLDGFSFGL